MLYKTIERTTVFENLPYLILFLFLGNIQLDNFLSDFLEKRKV